MPMTHIFPGQDDTEIIQRIVYKHIFSIMPFILVSLSLFIIGLFIVYASAAGLSFLPTTILPPNGVSQDTIGVRSAQTSVVSAFPLPWLLIGLGISAFGGFMLVATIYIWRQNRMILTDENVVDVDQNGLFRKDISTLRLSRVQDITVMVNGPMQTFFKYGKISIQTAGEHEHFEFDYVPFPYEVKRFIVDLFEKFVEHQSHDDDGTSVAEPQTDSLQADAVEVPASQPEKMGTNRSVPTVDNDDTFPIPQP